MPASLSTTGEESPARVETYSSFAYAVEPRAFVFREETHRVQEIVRQWRTPGCIHFYVHCRPV